MISLRVPLMVLAVRKACLRRLVADGQTVCLTTAALIPTSATPAMMFVR